MQYPVSKVNVLWSSLNDNAYYLQACPVYVIDTLKESKQRVHFIWDVATAMIAKNGK